MQQFDLGLNLSTKKTRKREFLEQMQQVVPWKDLVQLIVPYAPEGRTGRPPFPVEMLLRIHFLQQWFNLSDPAMEEALHDMALFREFAGLGWSSPTPDALAISRKMCLDFFIRYKKLETSAPNSFVLTGIDGKISISTSQIDFAMLQKLADIVKILEASLAANDANFAAPVQPSPVTASAPHPVQVQPPHPVITPEKAVQPDVQMQEAPVAQTPVVALSVEYAAPPVVSAVPAAFAVQVVDPAPAALVSVPSAYAAFDTTSPAPVWLSDAIEDWRLNGPNRFSEESWVHTYAATFRVLREVIGNKRRTIKLSDGSEQHNAPDIRVCVRLLRIDAAMYGSMYRLKMR